MKSDAVIEIIFVFQIWLEDICDEKDIAWWVMIIVYKIEGPFSQPFTICNSQFNMPKWLSDVKCIRDILSWREY